MHQRRFALLFAVAACSCGGAASAGRATSSTGGDPADDPPTRAGRLSSVEGAVSWLAPGSAAWARPAVNSSVTTGYRLYAGRSARAELDLGTTAVRVARDADVVVTNLAGDFVQLGLRAGTLEARLYQYAKDDSLEIDTPNGALVPAEGGTYVVSVEPDGGGTVVDVVNGTLAVSGPGVERTLTSGRIVRLSGSDPVRVVALGPSYVDSQPAFADLARRRERRDRMFTSNGTASRFVSPGIPGWEELDDNGVWVVNAAGNHAWCPKDVGADWVPYRDGRWSWVEPWGWTWVGDEPWGYAPYHYGRWEMVANHECRSGWAWVPGPVVPRPVWAPALVAFVDGAALQLKRGPDVEAWFPLGPREPFFPWYHHSDAYLRDVNATNLIEVRAVDSLVGDRDVRDFRRINRDTALTVVSSAAFHFGEPVGLRAISTRSDQLPPVRIAPHPSVNPADDVVAGGVGVAAPDIRAISQSRSLIARHAPPPPRPNWAARQPAMVTHPGRPLEPAQLANLRAGRPAGSPLDAEVPVHRVVAAPANAAERNAQLERRPRQTPRRQPSSQSSNGTHDEGGDEDGSLED
jgi:hypothetical protein